MLATVQFIAGCFGIIVVIGLMWLIYHLKRERKLIKLLTHINEDLLSDVQNLNRQVAQLKSERSILLLELENMKKGKK